MAVTEILKALGSWEIKLLGSIPRDVLDGIDYFGHVAIIPGRLDPAQYGDNLLDVARYVGVVRTKTIGDDGRTNAPADDISIGGVGMAFWLGDEDGKGDVYENAIEPASASFATTINMLLPASGAVTAGTIHSVSGTYTGRHQYETPRTAISYVCDTMSSESVPVSWRVNGDGTLDAGPDANLFVTNPTCVILSKGAGEDMALRALPGSMDVTRDMEDYSTRVVLLAEGEGDSIATGAADISPATGYKDIHGNPLKLTRLVSESDTSTTNAEIRAALQLSRFTSTRNALTLSTSDYDVHGSFVVGDRVWVYDPDAGLVDTSTEITFRGLRLNPIKLQVTETSWAITSGYTVAYRSANGVWTDLTDYVEFETDDTSTVTVGDFSRQLTNTSTEPIGSRPNADTSVPGIPTFVEPFAGSAYLDARGFTRARVILTWNAPNNIDGSTVLDGDHYEIRYAVDTDMIYPATWSQVSQIRWMDMQTWAQPFAAPDGQWQVMYVAWGETTAQLQDLSPGVGYDVQIRAVDKTGNTGTWSGTTTFVASSDNLPPSTPAAPSVAGSRIAVQVTHELGKSSGGTFNLESDLHHLEIHVDYEPGFTPSESTLKAKVSATAGMIQAQIPVVATVQVEETSARYVRVIAVDQTGNKSGPSDAASATALLIDDAHISDLTVTKVTAGTISANWLLGASIRTAETGARVELNSAGIQAYNSGGTQTVDIASADGSVSIVGQLKSGTTGKRIEINPTSSLLPEIRFYANTGSNYSFINAFDTNLTPDTAAGIQIATTALASGVLSTVAMDENTATFGRYKLNAGDDLYYATGGYSEAEDDKVRTAWFSGVGGNFGGSFLAQETRAEVGWFGASTSDWNYIHFDDDGVTRHYGIWSPECMTAGFATITPVANTPTSLTLTGFGPLTGNAFYGFVTAQTTVIGSAVQGVAHTNVTASSITVWVYRTNTTNTNLDWMIIGRP
ncbi:fibronectin type III domain-containing protein [Streptomyces ipomoeae]|uniref:fibronectin type III domain-containing protein n=1 Tax=Streptomyces ipomoeae TaxID=103232 RepID=UPI0029A8981D|nr:fibronectin type III domain-containing protein [Streptomyces ipomoeae]MDX2697020.1 fibronectin type III domain-containing protein [Streptomyces ipomoeae]